FGRVSAFYFENSFSRLIISINNVFLLRFSHLFVTRILWVPKNPGDCACGAAHEFGAMFL
ncbi:hypothetical protein L2734_19965, partial [Parashewanella spongiae]|uniref:hypothetical protein n=1 Tax=Parashewanella spongiae TaxID=342950 RepID=UPI00200EDCF7